MQSHGFTLIEIVISLLLLSFLVLGFDAMQIHALRAARAAYYFHIATQQLIGMTERLHALGNNQDLTEQVTLWNNQNQELLPTGKGTLSGNYPSYILKISWGQPSQECQQTTLGQSGCIQQRIQL